MTDNSPTAKIAADDLPTVGYTIRESDQFKWATGSEPPFAKAWRAVVYKSDAATLIDRLTRELAEARQQAALQALADSTQELGGYEVAKPDVEARAESLRDSLRLDWCQRHAVGIENVGTAGVPSAWMVFGPADTGSGKTLREAIDHAAEERTS